MPPSPARRNGWVPNQHGAWAMLAAPVATGVALGGPRWVHLPLTAFWFCGYLAFFAASQWLKSRLRPRYRGALVTYSAVACGLGLITLALDPRLVRFAWWFVVPATAGLWAAWRRAERAWWAGAATAAAAALMVPVATCAGDPSVRSWPATAVLGAYLVGTVLFVKSMIRERDNLAFRAVSVGYHALVTAGLALLAWWLTPLFLALTLRAGLLPRWRLSPPQVGVIEMVCTVAVVVAAVAVG